MSNSNLKEGTVNVTDVLAEFLSQNPDLLNDSVKEQLYETILNYREQFSANWNIDKIAAIKDAYRILDQFTMEYLQERNTFSCKKGCSFCCHMNVSCSKTEVEIIITYCKSKNIIVDQDYLKRQLKYSQEKIGKANEVSACIFLKNNECSIYDVRPISCRKYFVKSEPSFCNTKRRLTEKENVERLVIMDIEIFLSGILPVIEYEKNRLPKLLINSLHRALE